MQITDSVGVIKGIGEKTEKLFSKLGITTVEELLSFYPREYDIFTEIQPISSVKEGDTVIIEGTLATKPSMSNVRNLKIISCKFRDNSGQIHLSWFNMPYLMRSLKVGMHYIFRGKVVNKNGLLQIFQPKALTKEEYANWLGKLQPIYPLTAGITNNTIKKAVSTALKECTLEKEYLPLEIRKRYSLLTYQKSLRALHFPKNREEYAEARRRVVFEEFFLFSLALRYLKEEKGKKNSSFQLLPGKMTEEFLAELPFSLTEGQRKAWEDVKKDVAVGVVMNRLIQGDVGSGKTVVAMLGLLMAVESGYQGAIMVPTEVLAKQHYEEFQQRLGRFGIQIELLVGSMTAAQKKQSRERIANHEAQIIIGTHTLIQEKVKYNALALVVTDEQHRFGVRQRELFSSKGKEPHILVMSATPIPRTLAIILYGDLDVSVMEGLPKNRLPIKNCAVGTNYRPQAYRFMEKEVAMGHQIYVICPMVEESETTEVENVTDYSNTLRQVLSPSIRVEPLHGKMKAKEKNTIMEQFSNHQIDILVSTTVIEVGINVPNATVMMIENAERFGLAQLHQLRGRVGRGSEQSYCIFMAGNPSKETMERLKVMESSNDGFYIAKKDLELRGPGDLFGIRQSGELYFKMGDIYQDAKELQQANEAASEFTRDKILGLCKKTKGLSKKLERYLGDVTL